MQIKLFQEFFTHLCRSPTVGQNVIGQNYGNTTAGFDNRHNMLQEIYLIIRCFYKFRAAGRYVYAALRSCSERRICKYNVVHSVGRIEKGVLTNNRTFCRSYIVKIQIHRCKRYDKRCIVRSKESIVSKEILL